MTNTNRKLRMGMVGGGDGAFIGAIHRLAARMDGGIELVCGVFSSSPERSQEFGRKLYLQAERCYGSYQEMFQRESELSDELKMDFVSIVTPNHLHFPVSMEALSHGFHVVCDKPATLNLNEALALRRAINDSKKHYALTLTYTGYPMVRKAKELIYNGEIGPVNKVIVEYFQDWLADKDAVLSKQAEWRLDPARAGISCCMADIGVHAAHLSEFVISSNINSLWSSLNSSQADRVLDDEGIVGLKFANNATGILMASQVAVGEENNLAIRVYGEKGSLEWRQQEPNSLLLKYKGKATQILRAGIGAQSELVSYSMRTPAGHPEGYIEAFANLYRDFEKQIRTNSLNPSIPNVDDAIRTMAFIETVVKANEFNQNWQPIPEANYSNDSST